MFQEERKEVIEELLPKMADDLANDELAGIIADSNSVMWGYGDVQNIYTWNIKENEIGFTVELYLTGEPDEDRYTFFDTIEVKGEGSAIFEDGEWKISDFTVIEADRVYETDEHIDAVTSNIDSYQTFCNEIAGLKILNSINVADSTAQQILHKQIFVGVITCLETYLSDAFINKVLSNIFFLHSFFYNFDFNGRTLKLNELPNFADKIEEVAKDAMVEVLYHNLPKVSEIYKKILGVSVPDYKKLMRAVSTRHDLVHRNGKTKKGDEVFVNRADIENLINEAEDFVGKINEKIKLKTNPKYKDIEFNFDNIKF